MVKILRAAGYELGKARARIEDLEKDKKELRLEDILRSSLRHSMNSPLGPWCL